jgi:hypothetical protein
LEQGDFHMTQSWKSSSWKLGLGIAIATSAIASCGYYALAEDTEIPFRIQIIKPPGEQTDHTGTGNSLQLTSLTSDAPVSNVSVSIKEIKASLGPYTMNPGDPIPLNMGSCFNNTVTVQLVGPVGNPRVPRIGIMGEQTVAISQYTQSPPPMTFTRDGRNYTIEYQIVPSGCGAL